jgi:hypothetical protein
MLRLLGARFQAAVFGGDLRLRFQPAELRPKLAADILDASEVLARVGEPRLGLPAALLWTRPRLPRGTRAALQASPRSPA